MTEKAELLRCPHCGIELDTVEVEQDSTAYYWNGDAFFAGDPPEQGYTVLCGHCNNELPFLEIDFGGESETAADNPDTPYPLVFKEEAFAAFKDAWDKAVLSIQSYQKFGWYGLEHEAEMIAVDKEATDALNIWLGILGVKPCPYRGDGSTLSSEACKVTKELCKYTNPWMCQEYRDLEK